jgi:WhiB family transcriptional regulator, redox-sensing transcriptional regulator
MHWEEQARCHQFDPEVFFAPKVSSERRAKAICAKCPVREECLSFAIDSRMEFGVWGGVSWKERRSLLRTQTIPAGARSAISPAALSA